MKRAIRKTRARSLRKNSPASLGKELDKALPPAARALIRAVTRAAGKQNSRVYLVGGFVRDMLLGIPNLDLDIVVEGSAIRLGRALVKRFGGRLTVHNRFQTAVWLISQDRKKILTKLNTKMSKKMAPRGLPEFLDLITARREAYAHPGALPEIEPTGIREDLFRRDFTINTLAIRLDSRYGEFLNLWHGYEDLRRKKLRTLHTESFFDDPTRVLRILRLAGRLGFQIEKKTFGHMKTSLNGLKYVSGQRIYNECSLILREEKRSLILRELQRLGVLPKIHRDLRFDRAHEKSISRMPQNLPSNWGLENHQLADLGFVLWFRHFEKPAVSRLIAYLGMPASLQTAILSAIRLNAEDNLQNLLPSSMTSRLERVPPLALYALFLETRGTTLARKLARYVSTWHHIQPYTDGNRLQRLGLNPGPAYSRILKQLRDAWLDGEIKSRLQENALLKRLLEEYK